MRFSIRTSSAAAILLLMLILVFSLFVQFLLVNTDNPVPTPTYEDVNAGENNNNIFERRTDGSGNDNYDYSDDDEGRYKHTTTWRDYLFHAFRFGLFLFIICFPCLRGIRVWYAAGGRIRFRRTGGVDEDGNSWGWIIGLRYQAADLDRWLILSGYGHQVNGHNGAPGTPGGPERKLSPEEVYALPEIKFSDEAIAERTTAAAATTTTSGDIEQGSMDELAATYHGIGNSDSDSESQINSNINHNTDNPIDAISLSATTESEPGSATASTADSSRAEATDSPTDFSPQGSSSEETAAPSETATTARTKYPTLFTTTMSTSCSICIDDFEEGEKIRLLPHCGHAFHTECILPWLTERQGCCPCCKAAVICPPASAEENKENETDGDEINRNDRRTHIIPETGIWW